MTFEHLIKLSTELIHPGGCDKTTLYLLPQQKSVNQKHLIECFKDADVFTKFKSLKQTEQEEIIKSILVLPNEDKQVEKILYFIGKLS